jgi:hypothetical protein
LKKYLLPILLVLSITIPTAFADQKTRTFEFEDNKFDISYDFDGEVLAFGIDQEANSFLVATESVNDSTFTISFQHELLSAQDSEFVVLVDGLETDYTMMSDASSTTLEFLIPADTQEIEIVGTKVVPEFPFGAMVVMAAVSAMIILMSKARPVFK